MTATFHTLVGITIVPWSLIVPLLPATPAMIYWPYVASPEFPEMGEGGRTACAGPVFHWQPEFEKTNGFP